MSLDFIKKFINGSDSKNVYDTIDANREACRNIATKWLKEAGIKRDNSWDEYIRKTQDEYFENSATKYVEVERQRKLREKQYKSDIDKLSKLLVEVVPDKRLFCKLDRINDRILNLELKTDDNNLMHSKLLHVRVPKDKDEFLYKVTYYNLKFMQSSIEKISVIEFYSYAALEDHIRNKSINFIKLNLNYLDKFQALDAQMNNDVNVEAKLCQI